jgi:hypothetical protein
MAKQRLQGTDLSGRPVSSFSNLRINLPDIFLIPWCLLFSWGCNVALQIDVHYSLPKDNELEGRIDRDKHQATLFLSISQSNRPIDDAQLRAKFEIYGEIRSIKPFKDSP